MECTNCMDKVKYGGPGKKKRCCKQRKCLQDSIQKCDTAMETAVDTTTEATVNNTATVAAENHIAIVNASNDDKWVDLQCHDWWKLQPHLKQKVYNLWRKASKLQLGTWGVSTLSDSDINSLFPGNWLTDKVIMAFLKVASNIVEEMEKVKTFTVSTFLLSSINHNADLARRWYRNIDMEQFDIWLLPMNVNDNHLCQCDFARSSSQSS
ncbi:uncharacterized protein [Dysidea avara]|uniref:uncharacterized protein n=1 Tax=Dysidea avara TaxID=196820 RepID=UPI00331B7541